MKRSLLDYFAKASKRVEVELGTQDSLSSSESDSEPGEYNLLVS